MPSIVSDRRTAEQHGTEGSEECGMVCADGVYEKGTVNGTKFIAEAKELGRGV